MSRTLNMQFIRYVNLFGRISGVRAKHCFTYNNVIIFVVPESLIRMAIGQNNSNLRQLSEILGKRIHIIAQPKAKTRQEIESFVKTIVAPVEFNTFEISGDVVTITANSEGKARLIGRQRIRQQELQDILDQYFGIKKVIIA